MAIIKEFYMKRADGVRLYRTFSDKGYKLRKKSTNEIYDEAIDVKVSSSAYEETDELIEEGVDNNE